MNKFRFTINLLVIGTFLLAFAAIAQAQATRTWISGVGDDLNPCSRTAPCKTFAGAISKTAIAGEIDALDPGGFGAVTITKSITLDGGTGSGWASILASGTTGINVNMTTTDTADPKKIVILRRLSINGAGSSTCSGVTCGLPTGVRGINYTNAKALIVEDCQIASFVNEGIRASLTTDGKLYVLRTSIMNCADGIAASTTAGQIKGNIVESHFYQNANGIHATANARLVVDDCNVSGGSGAGILADGGTTGVIRVTHTTIDNNNGNGVTSSTTGVISLNDCDIHNNNGTAASASAGGVIQTFGNNRFLANGSDTCSGCTPAGATF